MVRIIRNDCGKKERRENHSCCLLKATFAQGMAVTGSYFLSELTKGCWCHGQNINSIDSENNCEWGEREKREANLKLLPTIEDSQVGDGRDRVLFPLQN